MSVTLLSDVQDQVQKFWAPLFKDELLETAPLPALVNKEYEGVIKRGGDTAYVSMIRRPDAQRKTIGVDADSFSSTKLETERVGIVADQRITAAVELEDMVDIQSQIGAPEGQSKLRQVLVEASMIELNKYLYSLVSPSPSSPDHILSGSTTFDQAKLLEVRALASAAKWPSAGGWWLLLDPVYFNHILNAQTLVSSDFVGDDRPVVGGRVATTRFGFNILEDNSEGILQLSPTNAGQRCGLAFHPDFLYLVMGEPNFKLSDLHSNKRHGYLLSVDMWVGAKIGIEGALKHISIYNV
ncbi:MAG: hypothetical protein QW818_02490 [Candidatus Aenigmatarchaeota archaeon]